MKAAEFEYNRARKRSYFGWVIMLIIGVLFLLIPSNNKNLDINVAYSFIIDIVQEKVMDKVSLIYKYVGYILGVLFIISSIWGIIDTKRLNRMFTNNQFKYGFDYNYELKVYENIGKYNKKKYCGKVILAFEKYSDWKNYITEKYIDNNECFVQRDFENFCRFLNRRRRIEQDSKDLITGLLVPVEVAILTFYIESSERKSFGMMLIVLSLTIVVVIICLKLRLDARTNEEFITDLFEVLKQNNQEKNMKQETIDRIRKFTEDRDWDQFHSPANLAKSIVIEAAELLECFQWDNDNYNLQDVKEELADVMVYCQNLADKLGLDPDEIINMKMDQNEAKYPVDKAKGKSDKYDQL